MRPRPRPYRTQSSFPRTTPTTSSELATPYYRVGPFVFDRRTLNENAN